MSRRKDRARADAGIIFRDGHLVRKEDWYAIHPTKEMIAQRQVVVDAAIKASNIVVLDPKDTSAVLAEAEPYYCTKCNVTHRKGKIHQEHHQYAKTA